MININDDMNKFCPKDMKSVLEHVSESYKGIYMNPEIIKEIADKIRTYVRLLHPYIENYIQIDNNDIRLSEIFAKDPKGVILFFFFFFDLRYGHAYDVFVHDERLGEIIFVYQQDLHSILTKILVKPDPRIKHSKRELYRMIQIKHVQIET